MKQKRRKGQFFIIGSVVILLILYNAVNALNSNWQTDVSEVQGIEAAQIFKNVERAVNTTVHVSDDSNLEQNLDAFLITEKKSIGEGYNLNARFNITSTDVLANITLSSDNFYAEKLIPFNRP